jgi:hypothetical protein
MATRRPCDRVGKGFLLGDAWFDHHHIYAVIEMIIRLRGAGVFPSHCYLMGQLLRREKVSVFFNHGPVRGPIGPARSVACPVYLSSCSNLGPGPSPARLSIARGARRCPREVGRAVEDRMITMTVRVPSGVTPKASVDLSIERSVFRPTMG